MFSGQILLGHGHAVTSTAASVGPYKFDSRSVREAFVEPLGDRLGQRFAAADHVLERRARGARHRAPERAAASTARSAAS